MPRLNVQGELRRRLSDAMPGVEVRCSVPDPRPARLVTVRRNGGRRLNALVDMAGVDVEAWAATDAEAEGLMQLASDAIAAMPFTGGFARIEEETMRDETNLRDAGGHWFASYTIHTYIPEGNAND